MGEGRVRALFLPTPQLNKSALMKAAELDSIKTLLATGANIDGIGERASPLISLSAGADPNAESVSPLSKLAKKKAGPPFLVILIPFSMTLCKMAQRQSLKCFWTPVPYH